jgi:hypothetical protein
MVLLSLIIKWVTNVGNKLVTTIAAVGEKADKHDIGYISYIV